MTALMTRLRPLASRQEIDLLRAMYLMKKV